MFELYSVSNYINLQKLKIEIVKIEKENASMEFDLINIGTPFVNAFRRVLLAEVRRLKNYFPAELKY